MMKIFKSICAAAGLVAVTALIGLGGGSASAASDGEWGTFEDVSGLVEANNDGYALVESISCASDGNCSAGGGYSADGLGQLFVVSQVDGEWQPFESIPGLFDANVGGYPDFGEISCASAGNCTAGGNYEDGGDLQVFVASQKNGEWQYFESIPGLNVANSGGEAYVNSVSCASVGNCVAGGYYNETVEVPTSVTHAFVASQIDGVWQSFELLPGLVDGAIVKFVSCAAANQCSVSGYYSLDDRQQVFVSTQIDGDWQTVEDVPGLEDANTGGNANVYAMSCSSVGNCAIGGSYSSISGDQAFVASQVGGVWQTFENIPGLNLANAGGDAYVSSVSCASVGECSVGGYYTDVDGVYLAFVASQVAGEWMTFENIPGLNLAANGFASVDALSCGSAGNCVASGIYTNASSNQVFAVSQVDGVWQTFVDVPGLTAANVGNDVGVMAVSCSSAGNCSVGGYYSSGPNFLQAFLASISTRLPELAATTTVAPETSTTVASPPSTTAAISTSTSPTVVPEKLPATGNNSNSSILLSLLLMSSGLLIAFGLRRRLG